MVEKSKKWAIVVVGLLLIGVIVSAGCIGDISDDKFELPAGVEIMDLADMSGMPPLPGGA